jgi:hypothetical protein
MEKVKTACAYIGDCVFVAMVVLLAWAFCELTPSQLSGEADWSVKACEDAGVDYAPAFGKEVR